MVEEHWEIREFVHHTRRLPLKLKGNDAPAWCEEWERIGVKVHCTNNRRLHLQNRSGEKMGKIRRYTARERGFFISYVGGSRLIQEGFSPFTHTGPEMLSCYLILIKGKPMNATLI